MVFEPPPPSDLLMTFPGSGGRGKVGRGMNIVWILPLWILMELMSWNLETPFLSQLPLGNERINSHWWILDLSFFGLASLDCMHSVEVRTRSWAEIRKFFIECFPYLCLTFLGTSFMYITNFLQRTRNLINSWWWKCCYLLMQMDLYLYDGK